MTRTPLKRRVETPPVEAAAVTPAPSDEAFRAECEALASAVAENLEAVLRPKAKGSARKAVAEAVSPGADAGKPGPVAAKPIHYPGGMDFVPAYSLIMKHAEAQPNDRNGTGDVIVSRELLEFLLRCVLDQMDFDEQQYQAANPDVAAAIKRKEMHSGREHFIKTGYFEGRSGGVRVDEAWYLARNPDVAAARKAGKFLSGAAQYRSAGAVEWRVPSPGSEDAIRMWKGVLGQ
jgi:hypothetical protein